MKKIKTKAPKTVSKRTKTTPPVNFHRAIIESLNDYAVITTDNKGSIQSWNEGAEKLFGYKEKEMLGKKYSRIFTSEDRKKKIPEKNFQHSLKKSQTTDERYFIRKDKSLFLANGIVFPIEDENHHHTGFTNILHDISSQKDFEKRTNDFIETATHEIRTPITIMKLFADIVKNKTKQGASTSLNDSVVGINDQIDRLIALTNYLLDISKIQEGKLQLEKIFFNVNNLLRLLVLTIQPTAPKHQLIVKSTIKNKAYGDCERITQVLTNLISNAVKYSPKGGKVIIKATQGKKGIVVSVQDFGLGIAKKEQGKLFTRFFRTETAQKQNINGIGLGLYIAKKIISGHDGKLGMKSVQGKGSTFYFSLPEKP